MESDLNTDTWSKQASLNCSSALININAHNQTHIHIFTHKRTHVDDGVVQLVGGGEAGDDGRLEDRLVHRSSRGIEGLYARETK